MPDVSVIMPMRNVAPFVREAARSVLEQSFSALELVVVDDGSTDDSRAIVESIGDRRVRVVEGPRKGFAAAWNTGLREARAPIFIQSDGDDRMTPDRIARQVAFLNQNPRVGAVGSGMSTMDPAGRPVMNFRGSGQPEDITAELLSGKTRTSFCTFAARTDILRGMGGMREFFETSCDLDLQFRLAERTPVYYEPVLSYVYRLHDASVTHLQSRTRRDFFEEYARTLRLQRSTGGSDDLDLGRPATPPSKEAPTSPTRLEVQGMLLGEAWRVHGDGRRWAALKLGLRALACGPGQASVWKSVGALVVKPARRTGN
jgi:glycosyltransferase involved in cell wall biosynthesis